MTSINQQLKKAIGLSLLGRYSAYIVQLALLMLYARWFSPEEFGVLAAIQVFVIFFMMLAEIGLGPALINQRQLSEKDRDGLFSLTWLIGSVMAILFYFATYGLNQFYGRDDYQLLGLPICISILFNAASTLPIAFLQREKRFITIARTDIFAELPALVVLWWILKSGFPLYALAIRPLAVSITRYLLNYIASAKTEFGRPSFGQHFAAIKPLLGFSSYQFAFNFINYFSRNLDNILVGHSLGMGALGVYDKAYALMKYPLQLLTFAITPAIQPVLSKHADDVNLIELTHSNLIRRISILGVLVGMIMGVSSNQITLILLGDKWKNVGPILEIFSLIVPIQVAMSSGGGFFQVLGRTKLLFKCGLFAAATNISAILFGIYMGALDLLAWALVVSFCINFIQSYTLMYKQVFHTSVSKFIIALLPSIAVAIAGLTSWHFMKDIFPFYDSSMFILIVNSASIIVGVIFIWVLNFFLISKKISVF